MIKKHGKTEEDTPVVKTISGEKELDRFFREQLRVHAASELFFTQERDGSFIAYTQQEDAEKRQYHLNRVYHLNHSILRISK